AGAQGRRDPDRHVVVDVLGHPGEPLVELLPVQQVGLVDQPLVGGQLPRVRERERAAHRDGPGRPGAEGAVGGVDGDVGGQRASSCPVVPTATPAASAGPASMRSAQRFIRWRWLYSPYPTRASPGPDPWSGPRGGTMAEPSGSMPMRPLRRR